MDGKVDLNRICQVIEASGADLIGLNEVDRFFSNRSHYVDQIFYLAERLQMKCAFGSAYTFRWRGRSQYGNALLTRFPISSFQNHSLDFYPTIVEGRALLETEVRIEKQIVKVYVTHLSLNPLFQRKQIECILQKLKAESLPHIILGDWNMKPGSAAWKKVTKQLIDVCDKSSRADDLSTFPSAFPTIRLDHIFVSQHFQVFSAEVIHFLPLASDHLPLLASIELHKNMKSITN